MNAEETDLDGLMGRLAAADIKQGNLPPVNDWQPARQYRIKIRIDRDGRWYYQESEIKRQSMVRLFASILRRDGDDYYLVTPQEKLLIQVDALPLVATEMDQLSHPERLIFSINTGEMVVASKEHPLVVEMRDNEPYPMIHVRDRLYALVHRNVFYRLADMAEVVSQQQHHCLRVTSSGVPFDLGYY